MTRTFADADVLLSPRGRVPSVAQLPRGVRARLVPFGVEAAPPPALAPTAAPAPGQLRNMLRLRRAGLAYGSAQQQPPP